MQAGVFVIGMHLDREILTGINELDENRQPVPDGGMGAQILGVLLQYVGQGTAVKRPAGHCTGAVGVSGTLPGFGQGVQINPLGKVIVQAVAAPQIILARRLEKQRRGTFRFRGDISVCHGH